MEKLLTTEQAADALGLEPKTLVNWRCKGHPLPWVALGRKAVRYRPSDLEAFIAGSRVIAAQV